jgi:hypothetical protein
MTVEIALARQESIPYNGEIDDGVLPMAGKTVDEVIAGLTAEIAALDAEAKKKKETVNTLCGVIGRAPAYTIEDAATVIPTQIRSDQFYGQPLAASVRTILEMRRAQNLGAATVSEIYDVLTAGGYEFDTKSDDIARKSLRNSLAKNTALFHKLPNGQFGLLSWYPNAKKPKAGSSAGQNDDSEEQVPDATDEESAITEPKPYLD